MKKLYILLVILFTFLLWRYSYQIELFIEKKFNTFQVCNISEYEIENIHIQWYSRWNNSINFSKIKPWKCSNIKKSFRFSRFYSSQINVSLENKYYHISHIPMDNFWDRKLNVWHVILEFKGIHILDNNGQTITRPIMELKEDMKNN